MKAQSVIDAREQTEKIYEPEFQTECRHFI